MNVPSRALLLRCVSYRDHHHLEGVGQGVIHPIITLTIVGTPGISLPRGGLVGIIHPEGVSPKIESSPGGNFQGQIRVRHHVGISPGGTTLCNPTGIISQPWGILPTDKEIYPHTALVHHLGMTTHFGGVAYLRPAVTHHPGGIMGTEGTSYHYLVTMINPEGIMVINGAVHPHLIPGEIILSTGEIHPHLQPGGMMVTSGTIHLHPEEIITGDIHKGDIRHHGKFQYRIHQIQGAKGTTVICRGVHHLGEKDNSL